MHGGAQSLADGLQLSESDVLVQTLEFSPQIQSILAELRGAQASADASLAVERATGQSVVQEMTW